MISRSAKTDWTLFFFSFSNFSFYLMVASHLAHVSDGPLVPILLAISVFGFSLANAQRYFVATTARSSRFAGLFLNEKSIAHKIPFRPDFAMPFAQILALCSLQLVSARIDLRLQETLAQNPKGLHVFSMPSQIFPTELLGLAFAFGTSFFLYGLVFGDACSEASDAPQFPLAAEWLGAAAGVTLTLLLLEYLPIHNLEAAAMLAPVAGFLAATLKARAGLFVDRVRGRKFYLLTGLFFTLVSTYGLYFKFSDSVNLLNAQYSNGGTVRWGDTQWTTQGALRIAEGENAINGAKEKRNFIVLGRGKGRALIPTFGAESSGVESAEVAPLPHLMLALAVGQPKAISILFAGAGIEMVAADRMLNGAAQIDGVELNGRLVSMADEYLNGQLRKFFSQSNIHFYIEDARGYIERLSEPRDLIFFSWNGSPNFFEQRVYSHSAQNSFTQEGLRKSIERLAPSGGLFIVGGHKLNLLISLREITESLGLGPLEQRVVILKPTHMRDQIGSTGWDQLLLYYRKAEWSPEQLAQLESTAARVGYAIALAPAKKPDSKFLDHARLVSGTDLPSDIRSVNRRPGQMFRNHNDDSPFVFNTLKYLHRVGMIGGGRLGAVLSIVISVLILVGVLLFIRAWAVERVSDFLRVKKGLMAMTMTGVGHMLLQVVILHFAFLWFGTPISSGILAVGAFAGLTGLANVLVDRVERFGSRAGIDTFFSICIFLLIAEGMKEQIFHLPLLLRVPAFLILMLPVAIFSGFTFARSLAEIGKIHRRMIHLALAFDGLMATFAALASPYIVDTYGIFVCALVSGFCYLALGLAQNFPSVQKPRDQVST